MLQYAFSFRGRIGRLRYFTSSIVIGIGFVVILVAVVAMANPAKSPIMALVLGGLALILMLPAMLWSSLSLQARRIRDIGFDPIYVLPTWFMVLIADALVARGVPHLAVMPHAGNTAFGVILNLLFSLALLFWPGNGGSDMDDMRRRLDVFDGDPEPVLAEAPRILVTRTAPSALRAPRTTFGRRGL